MPSHYLSFIFPPLFVSVAMTARSWIQTMKLKAKAPEDRRELTVSLSGVKKVWMDSFLQAPYLYFSFITTFVSSVLHSHKQSWGNLLNYCEAVNDFLYFSTGSLKVDLCFIKIMPLDNFLELKLSF